MLNEVLLRAFKLLRLNGTGVLVSVLEWDWEHFLNVLMNYRDRDDRITVASSVPSTPSFLFSVVFGSSIANSGFCPVGIPGCWFFVSVLVSLLIVYTAAQ